MKNFPFDLKAFITVAVTTEEKASFFKLNKDIGKQNLYPFVWTNHPAIRKWWLMATDNDMVNPFILFKSLQFASNTKNLFHLVLFFKREL